MFLLALILLVFVIVILTMAYHQVAGWTFPKSDPVQAQSADSPFREVILTTEDNLKIYAWYAPPTNGHAILMLHGHTANRDQLMGNADYLMPVGYGIMSIDFRNHGDSDGDRTSLGYHEVKDARAAYDFLMAQDEVDDVVIYGASMGGAVGSRLMQDVDAAGLVIHATFADFPSTVRAGVVARGFPDFPITNLLLTMYTVMSGANWDEVHPEVHFANIKKPILLMHGTEDALIPVEHAYRLAAANDQVQLEIYEGGGHGDLFERDPDRYKGGFLGYLDGLFN